ncbi:MAG: formate dehydrogenase subunit delta [Candidatus Nanopelagicales bacterium]|jgi:hypothetical protein|nr:formate dehydrogenase subunit delta [Candidatus Nanopelagicales bacterium]MDP4667032.1 formate dehydrogenase subunit delta [Candidatus Nanopelagicales bacterium]MDP4895709.1 formate dehydrogenase subunit delta [Candidatus Nanopelagicales bacterium]MDP5050545.1 formate dehydrogenase subunit delta [Candidatus Nanopelagicales bacterium]
MDVAILTRMAEQIERNIPVHEDTYLRISEHLVKFWTPQMRTDFYQQVTNNRKDFSTTLNKVVDELRAKANA